MQMQMHTHTHKHTHARTPDSLFELLMQMVSEPVPSDNQLAVDLSSVASACLLSLVVALGDTGKMLSAVAAMLTAPAEYSLGTVQVCVYVGVHVYMYVSHCSMSFTRNYTM